MNEYMIVSDATLDLPADIIHEYGIRVIPMGVSIDDFEFNHHPDEKELTIEAFYGKLKNGSASHTSQITPVAFQECFKEILNRGMDILYIAFSSGLSGTYNASQIAVEGLSEQFPDRKIYSVDTLCASIGEGLLVYLAAQKKRDGMTIDALRDWVEQNKRSIRHWFTVKDLFYLKRGGRLSSVEALIGTALKIRPVLSTDYLGKLEVVTKIRGYKAELELFLNKLETEGTDLATQTIMIGHADNLEQAKELEGIIKSRGLVKEIIVSSIGPVIGTHTGPGMLALTFVGKQ